MTPVLAPFPIAPPVIDCLGPIARRPRVRRPPFSADRDHMHHRLADLGLSPSAIVIRLVAPRWRRVSARRWRAAPHAPEPMSPAAYLSAAVAYFMVTRCAVTGMRPRPLAEPAPARATAPRADS